MQQNAREQWFHRVSHLATNHPKKILLSTLVVLAVSFALLPGLQVSTSRQGLVAKDNPYQKRLHEFLNRFGDPTSPVFFVVSGGDKYQRRQMVDRLATALSREPEFQDKVVSRLGPEHVAEVLLLQSPTTAREIRALAPSNVDLATFIEGGLPSYAGALQERISNLASALQMRMLMGFGPMISPTDVEQILTSVDALARTMDSYLAGENPWKHMNMQTMQVDMVDSAGYIAGQDNDYLLVSIFPDFAGDEVHQQKPIIEKLRSIRNDVLRSSTEKSGIKVQLTGLPTLAVDELEIIKSGLSKSSLATGTGIFILFLLAFRSLRHSLFAGIPLVVGIISSLAFVRVFFGQLNLITSSFISVLLGLGIDFPVHLLARFNEARHNKHSVAESIRRSLANAGPGVLTGAITTILAFLTITTTEFTAFAELGIITAAGLVFMVAATFTMLPALIYPLESKRDKIHPRFPQVPQLVTVIKKAPKLVLIASSLAAIYGAISIAQIQFNYRYFDFLPQNTESSQALRMLENDLVMGPTFANLSASSVEEARDLTQKLRELPSVASVQTATDLLPPLDATLTTEIKQFFKEFPTSPNFSKISATPVAPEQLANVAEKTAKEVNRIKELFEMTGQPTETAEKAIQGLLKLQTRLQTMQAAASPLIQVASEAIENIIQKAWNGAHAIAQRGTYLPSDVPEILKQRFVSQNNDAIALYIYPKGDIWDKQFASQFSSEIEQLAPEVSGFAITLHAHSTMILSGFKRATLIAIFLICLLLLYDFRKISDAFMALLPTCIGWLWMLAIMASWNIPFDVANIVVLPLVLGIGIDAGVHMVHRYRQSTHANGVAQLSDLIGGTGAAVLLSSTTTIVGFAGLMLADYGGMKSLGLVMVLGISSCLVACLLVLPTILLLLRRVQ